MAIHLDFEITLLSDFHISSGYGDGLVDTLLLRDHDGYPVIRGTTIVGLLRDGLYQMLHHSVLSTIAQPCHGSIAETTADTQPFESCGPMTPRESLCPICRIFGTPAVPKPWRFSGARPVSQPEPKLVKGSAIGGHTVQRARISPRSRRVEAHKLFSQELGEAVWRFRFTAQNPSDSEQDCADAALLVAAARAVRGLGQARRRGRGSCRIHLVDRGLESRWMTAFKDHWIEQKPTDWPAVISKDRMMVPSLAFEGEKQPKRFHLFARAMEPLVLANRGEAANEFESSHVIPGNVVLGVLAGRVARAYDLADPNAREVFTELFRHGHIRFSHLQPAELKANEETLVPTIPAPLDMLTCKAFPGFQEKGRDEHVVKGYALSSTPPKNCPDCKKEHGEEVPLKPLKDFLTVSQQPHHYRPRTRHEMHIAVDPQTRRVREGDLYGYVGLDAGQYFIGEIVCDDVETWDALKQMANLPDAGEAFTGYVGRASQRGHGKMLWAYQEVGDGCPQALWCGLPLADRIPDNTREFTMTLITDTIVPDSGSGQREGFSLPWLMELFGPDIEIVRSFARTRTIDGFWQHLGLPRFRDIALVAGSTVGIRMLKSSTDLRKMLAEWEASGVGLRCHEGFGQVVFNHPLYDQVLTEQLKNHEFSIPTSLKPQDSEGGPVKSFSLFEEEWRERLQAKEYANVWRREDFSNIARLIHQHISGSLGDLETALRDPKMNADDDTVGQFGQPGFLLTRAINAARDEKKHVVQTRKGRQAILSLLDELTSLIDQYASSNPREQLRQRGLMILADQVGRDAEHTRLQTRSPISQDSSHPNKEVS